MSATQDRGARWQRYWDKHAGSYDRQMRFMDRVLFGDSRQWACSQATGEVLEVAIGTGLNLAAYPDGITLTGIDLSEDMLAIARTRAAGLDRPVKLLQGNAHALPFGDAEFDTVVCTLGLCAIPDIEAAIKEMERCNGFSNSPRSPWPVSTSCAGRATTSPTPGSPSSTCSASRSVSWNG